MLIMYRHCFQPTIYVFLSESHRVLYYNRASASMLTKRWGKSGGCLVSIPVLIPVPSATPLWSVDCLQLICDFAGLILHSPPAPFAPPYTMTCGFLIKSPHTYEMEYSWRTSSGFEFVEDYWDLLFVHATKSFSNCIRRNFEAPVLKSFYGIIQISLSVILFFH